MIECNEQCVDTDGSAYCTCFNGPLECDSHSHCLTGAHNCHPSASCIDRPNSFSCKCNEGFVGTGLSCLDKDECARQTHTCEDQCINTIGSFECSCRKGYIMKNGTCEDIDECKFNVCGATSICINYNGGYLCQCTEGYYGNGDTLRLKNRA